ncbi:MAG: maleylpyruvate isomerase family mycothiol-dependent enzyme [Streptosporangiaceae bacterium]
MTVLNYDRYCAEIVTQTDLLSSCVKGADPAIPAPSCPGWSLGRLLRHLGDVQRWAETIVRSRATGPVEHSGGRSPDGAGERAGERADDLDALGAWLVEGAERLADTLRRAGPGTSVWAPAPDGSTDFYARRMTHETAMHRADATLAVGAEFTVDQDVALDGIDEWMELGSMPMRFEFHPAMRELLGPGRTLHLHATDTAPEAAAEWLVDLTGDAITWRRAHEKAAVAVRGPLTDLLLVIYKRRPAAGGGVEVFGDAQLLDFWLERVSFG